MKLRTRSKLSELIREGYQGRAITLVPEYPVKTVAHQMLAHIDSKTKVRVGPTYNGEAERLILDPMYIRAAAVINMMEDGSYTPGILIREFYAYATHYSLIVEVAKVSQTKEIANAMTFEALQQQTIVSSILKSSRAVSGDMAKDAKDIWSRIYADMSIIDADKISENGDNPTPIFDVLSSMTDGNKEVTAEATLKDVFDTLMEHLRKGKGFPLSSHETAAYASKLATIRHLLARLEERLGTTQDLPGVRQDFLAMAYALSLYLEMVQNYDVTFPAGPFQSQSQAWVMSIHTGAARLRSFWMETALMPISFDTAVAAQMWQSTKDFFDPIFVKNLQYSEVMRLWDETSQQLPRVLVKYAQQAAQDAIAAFREHTAATHLLPSSWTSISEDIVSKVAEIEEFNPDPAVVMSFVGATDPITYSKTRINVILMDLTIRAQSIQSTVSYISKARRLVSFTADDLQPYAPLAAIDYTRYTPLRGSIGVPSQSGFTRRDPLELLIDKYTYDEKQPTSPKWCLHDKLFKPIYLLKESQALATRTDRFIWPTYSEVPTSDPISAAYMAQPLFAAHTRHRNPSILPRTMQAYTNQILGQRATQLTQREYFLQAAVLIATRFDQFGRSIVNALAASMSVFLADADSSKGWSLLLPEIPTVYGVPTQSFFRHASKGKDEQPSFSASLVEMVKDDYAVVKIPDSNVFIGFKLHAYVPSPSETYPVAFKMAKGVFVSAPLRRDLLDSVDALKKLLPALSADEVSVVDCKNLSSIFIPAIGLTPFLLNLPHVLFEVQSQDAMLTTNVYLQSAYTSVKTKLFEYSQEMDVAAFTDLEVDLLDMDDYADALSVPDDIPSQSTPVTSSEPEGSEVGGVLQPRTNGPDHQPAADFTSQVKATTERAGIAAVTGSPILTPTETDKGTTLQVIHPVHDETLEGRMLGGDPSDVSAPEVSATIMDDAAEEYEYYQLEDGSVIRLKKGATPPAKSTLTNKEAYDKFVAGAGSGDDSENQDGGNS